MSSWFEEQIKQRIEQDDEFFAQVAAEVRAAVTRKRYALGEDERARFKGALDDVLVYFGVKPRDIPDSITDINDQIEYVCHPHGIMRRGVKLERGWYKDAAGAMLGWKTNGTPVALLPGKLGRYTFQDPDTGEVIRLNAHNQDMLEKDAVCFYRPFPLKKLGIPDLMRYMLHCLTVPTAVMILLATLAATLVGLLTPKITQMLFSTVLEQGSMRLLLALAVLSVSVTLSTMFLDCIKTLLMDRIQTELNITVEAATMARMLSLPASFYKQYSSGELTSRSEYVSSLCDTIVSTILSTGLTSVFSLVYITQIFNYAAELLVPSLVITAVTLAFTVVSSLAQIKISARRMESDAKQSGMTYSLISGVQKLKLSGSEKRAFSRWLKVFAESVRLTWSPPLFLMLNGAISTAISLTGTIVMYFFAVKCGVTVADYYAFTAAYGVLSGAFMSMAGIALTVANIKPTLDMARPIIETVPEISADKKMVSSLSGGIELNNVQFRYQDDMPNIVDDLSLKIRPGQYVAIVGRTGCGKSTLVRLLLGFETPQKGAVYYDGRDLASLDLCSVRRHIGCVTQNGKLFQGDIFSNIVISAPWLTLDDAWRAAEIAGIADDIRDMPMGMNTVISEGSGGISGGQKQRLMIARAVAPSPKILILDEATSALDNITQKKVSEALDGLKCTRLVIAHRLSTIRQCDRIIVLDGGKIVEDGSYEELIAQEGFFAELVKRQRVEI